MNSREEKTQAENFGGKWNIKTASLAGGQSKCEGRVQMKRGIRRFGCKPVRFQFIFCVLLSLLPLFTVGAKTKRSQNVMETPFYVDGVPVVKQMSRFLKKKKKTFGLTGFVSRNCKFSFFCFHFCKFCGSPYQTHFILTVIFFSLLEIQVWFSNILLFCPEIRKKILWEVTEEPKFPLVLL